MMVLNRRTVVAGLGGLAITRNSIAATVPPSPIAHGALAYNDLARAFEPSPPFPSISFIGRNNAWKTLADYKGKTVLMPLWAEWCTPCLSELGDFARLQKKYGGATFAIVPVLSGTQKDFTPEALTGLLAYLHADIFEPLIEMNRGARLLKEVARRGESFEIPCNLLIGPDGNTVAREFGTRSDNGDAPISDAAKKIQASGESETLARAEAGEVLSLWGEKPGEEFAAAMANGFLARG
jgi:thiol-disulfide isomerase/thioredoxin